MLPKADPNKVYNFYHTKLLLAFSVLTSELIGEAKAVYDRFYDRYKDKYRKDESGLTFGTIAVRSRDGFFTTARGKNEMDGRLIHVLQVRHDTRTVFVSGTTKASLNAPLLAHIFSVFQNCKTVVHYHEQEVTLPTVAYAPPGTAEDSIRPVTGSFNISDHGCFLLFDMQDRLIEPFFLFHDEQDDLVEPLRSES